MDGERERVASIDLERARDILRACEIPRSVSKTINDFLILNSDLVRVRRGGRAFS